MCDKRDHSDILKNSNAPRRSGSPRYGLTKNASKYDNIANTLNEGMSQRLSRLRLLVIGHIGAADLPHP